MCFNKIIPDIVGVLKRWCDEGASNTIYFSRLNNYNKKKEATIKKLHQQIEESLKHTNFLFVWSGRS